jgi:transcriptional regulator with XRE-family HTH domain
MQAHQPFNLLLGDVGTTLAHLRQQKGYKTIKEFAVKHDLPEIQYWRMEKGKSNVTLKSLVRILQIHGLSLHQFFCLISETQKVNSDVLS